MQTEPRHTKGNSRTEASQRLFLLVLQFLSKLFLFSIQNLLAGLPRRFDELGEKEKGVFCCFSQTQGGFFDITAIGTQAQSCKDTSETFGCTQIYYFRTKKKLAPPPSKRDARISSATQESVNVASDTDVARIKESNAGTKAGTTISLFLDPLRWTCSHRGMACSSNIKPTAGVVKLTHD